MASNVSASRHLAVFHNLNGHVNGSDALAKTHNSQAQDGSHPKRGVYSVLIYLQLGSAIAQNVVARPHDFQLHHFVVYWYVLQFGYLVAAYDSSQSILLQKFWLLYRQCESDVPALSNSTVTLLMGFLPNHCLFGCHNWYKNHTLLRLHRVAILFAHADDPAHLLSPMTWHRVRAVVLLRHD